MSSLRELQHAFVMALAGERSFPPVAAAMVPGRMARRSLALYRRLIRNNYVHTLTITYPVLRRFVGNVHFRTLARGYIRHSPSTSGDLFLYGCHFPAFLSELQLSPLLIELARLEWACHEVHQAADALPLSQEQFEALASADPSDVTFRLNAAVRLLRFSLPIHRVWLALQPDAPTDIGVDLPLPEEETCVVVTRTGGRIRVETRADLDYRLVEAMADRKTVAEIEQTATQCDPRFDFNRFLASVLDLGLLGSIETDVRV